VNTLERLEQEADRFLKTLRDDPQNGILLKRLRLSHPAAPVMPELPEIQHLLARERGYENWIALKTAVLERDAQAPARAGDAGGSVIADRATRIATFLEDACWDHHVHGRGRYAMAEASAMRALARAPDIARAELYTAIVCGEIDEMRRILDAQPDLVNAKGGPRRWEPLLYLCYARLPLPALRDNAIAMARDLLDRGANPDAYYMAGDSIYGALVGVAGEGEQDAPPHVQRDGLYALLLERGAEPFDIQVLYNTFFHGNVAWWLELTYAHTVAHGQAAAWNDPEWMMLGMGGYGSGARFLLEMAIKKGNATLVEWLLAHGASPNAAPAPAKNFSKRSLFEEAVRQDREEIAQLLLRHGATPQAVVFDGVLDGDDALFVAAMRLNGEAARAVIAKHPECLRSHKAIFEAARRDRADAVALLLDLGVPIEIEDATKQHPLHIAAWSDARRVASLLIERGADIDPLETSYDASPIGFASYANNWPMIDLLAPVSRHVWTLAGRGKIERLREIFSTEPERATVTTPDGMTLLWCLPDDEARAIEIVELLLAHGADPRSRTTNGSTAADYARRRGLDRAADILTAAAAART
jgi:ankyrin repeat protein